MLARWICNLLTLTILKLPKVEPSENKNNVLQEKYSTEILKRQKPSSPTVNTDLINLTESHITI